MSVWFSENAVSLGSNLMREIDKELSALLARDLLVPIVHGVTYDDLREESPLLASRSGLDTADDTMEEIAIKISELVSTDAFSE